MEGAKLGEHLEPLDDEDTIFLMDLVDQSSDDEASPAAFRMSDREKEQDPRRISVWETELSTPAQIYSILRNPKRQIVLFLDVSDVREIDIRDMDVVWDHLPGCLDGSDHFDGCEGHSAVIGWPEKGEANASNKRKRIRWRLARAVHEIQRITE